MGNDKTIKELQDLILELSKGKFLSVNDLIQSFGSKILDRIEILKKESLVKKEGE